MAYATPTAAQFKARFPEFGTVPDALVDMIIAEAEPSVGVTWIDADRSPAVLYLTAHLLAVQGYPLIEGAVPGDTTQTGPMKRRKVGDVEVEFAGMGASSGGSAGKVPSQYAGSWYGIQFWRYAQQNFSPIAVV